MTSASTTTTGDDGKTESHDSHVVVTAQPPSPAKVEPAEQHSSSSVEALERKVASLQEALDLSENQTQVINMEYKKLLAEKEVSLEDVIRL